ncbi:hypothetical protein LTR78_008851 [Recurvomyces mirabilis]|uniref:Uncharacterized protein n=1 Tax=Recurvomyces mirabilis TaxID=574656 RepID=A0AAE0WIM8_9PEZI|nr:hypothetical protein LTR78_008851 [Recurvomyces mirabilis]KAK5155766.1 hypothetical protein LTS14_005332 [Recurvomyces mirabilis]
MAPVRVLFCLIIITLYFRSGNAGNSTQSYHSIQFHHFYPSLAGQIEGILRDGRCNATLARYYNTSSHFDSCRECRPQASINCILDHFDSVTKANIASAAVILGLLPATLSSIGLSYVETGILALRRPGLAFLLAIGSPSVSPIKTFDYRGPSEILRKDDMAMRMARLGQPVQTAVFLLEYLLAIGATVNIGVVTWQLCVRTFCSFATDTWYMPSLWPLTAIAIHVGAALAVFLRVRFERQKPQGHKSWTLFDVLRNQWIPYRDQPEMILKRQAETMWFIMLSWVLSTGTVLHIVLGTLVFSSLLPISTSDAVQVAARYVASAVVCRAVLQYELACMRQDTEVEDESRSKSNVNRV